MYRCSKDDNPFVVAKQICEEHNLSDKYVEPLAQNIIENAKQVLEQNIATERLQQSEKAHGSNQDSKHTPRKNSEFFTLGNKENLAENVSVGKHTDKGSSSMISSSLNCFLI